MLSLAVVLASSSAQIAVAETAPVTGGTNQVAGQTACTNTWLFNGLWRYRVTKVEPVTEGTPGQGPWRSGWAVSVEVRNGTTKEWSTNVTGFFPERGVLGLADGSDLHFSDATPDNTSNVTLEPGEGKRYVLRYLYDYTTATDPQPDTKPVKFVTLILPENEAEATWKGFPHYTVKDPSYRFDLTCTK